MTETSRKDQAAAATVIGYTVTAVRIAALVTIAVGFWIIATKETLRIAGVLIVVLGVFDWVVIPPILRRRLERTARENEGSSAP